MDMSPVTVREFVPLMSIPVLALTVDMVMEAHDAATSTVTRMLELITTASAEVGTAAPPQVVVLDQFPLTLAVLVAPNAVELPTAERSASRAEISTIARANPFPHPFAFDMFLARLTFEIEIPGQYVFSVESSDCNLRRIHRETCAPRLLVH